MKKSLLAIGLTALVFIGACKKEEVEEFLATNMTGTAVISGKITNNMIVQNQGFGYQTMQVPAQGIQVQVRIWNEDLYPNSPNTQGSQVYSGTTDANGNYSITVTTNSDGCYANITIANRVGTLDSLINGVVKTGQAANFNGTNNGVWVYTGSPATFNHNMSASVIVGNPMPITIGTAVITGTISAIHMEEDTFPGPVYYYTATLNKPLANHPVKLDFYVDPLTMIKKVYTATTNASGVYSITVTTSDESGFNPYGYLKVADYVTGRDTLRLGGTTTTGVVQGAFDGNGSGMYIGNIYPNEHINHQDIVYSNWH